MLLYENAGKIFTWSGGWHAGQTPFGFVTPLSEFAAKHGNDNHADADTYKQSGSTIKRDQEGHEVVFDFSNSDGGRYANDKRHGLCINMRAEARTPIIDRALIETTFCCGTADYNAPQPRPREGARGARPARRR